MPRLQPHPRRTQHADFPHCAPPFASCRGLWDLSCWGDFRPVASHPIAVEQPRKIGAAGHAKPEERSSASETRRRRGTRPMSSSTPSRPTYRRSDMGHEDRCSNCDPLPAPWAGFLYNSGLRSETGFLLRRQINPNPSSAELRRAKLAGSGAGNSWLRISPPG